MQRTKYWNQTRPTDIQLGWTETSKINAIRQRLRSSAQMGIAWGFVVTVNGTDNTKIDISRGEGYSGGMFLVNEFETTGSGERISTYVDSPSGTDDTGPAATQQALADYTAGVENYVSLVFGEVESQPLAERAFPFQNRQTVVTETFTVSVLTAAQWGVLDSEELNKRILVAIVTANGAGTALTTASIDQFVQPKTHPSASAPTALTGVTIVSLAEVTPLGTATLRWDASASELYYTAPGDTEGTGVAFADSGSFTLYSNNTIYSITVNINFASLSTVSSQSETISISSFYGRTIPMFSAVDQIHRDMVGSGQPVATNPHGLTLDDIGGGGFDHADLFHVNGISHDADSDQLNCQIDAINDRVQVTNLGGYANSFLVDGNTAELISGYAAGAAGYESFAGLPADDPGDYLIYLDSNAALQRVKIAGYTEAKAPEWPLWDVNIAIMDIHNTTAGNGTITWDATAETLTYEAPGDGGAGDEVRLIGDTAGAGYHGYYKLYSLDTDNWIIVRLDGVIGGSTSSTFSIVKDETTYSDESMLKLCIVNWTGGPLGTGSQQLNNLRDIRNYITADVKSEFEEEHTKEGYHTKPFRHNLRVAHDSDVGVSVVVANSGVVGEADTVIGIYGSAANTGIFGIAATNNGVHGSAASNNGVYGVAANNNGVYGSAGAVRGVYGTAPDEGVYGAAGTDIGVRGTAATNTGVYGQASSLCGVVGGAAATGVYGSASNTGVIGSGALLYGGYFNASETAAYASASNTAIYGIVTALYGGYFKASASAIYGSANDTAVYAIASNDTAVYATADIYGVYATVASNSAGYFRAGGDVGVYAYADVDTAGAFQVKSDTGVYVYASDNTGVYAEVENVGIYATAATNTGVYGEADASGGVFTANAGNYGVWAEANTHTGVYGHAQGATGAYGSGEDSIGVYGRAPDIGVYGEAAAGDTGVYGSASDVYGIYGTASNYAGRLNANAGNGVAVWLEGLIRYDIGTQAVQDNSATIYSPAFHLPIIVQTGTATVTMAFAVYDTV
jgi:hypothetical protein